MLFLFLRSGRGAEGTPSAETTHPHKNVLEPFNTHPLLVWNLNSDGVLSWNRSCNSYKFNRQCHCQIIRQPQTGATFAPSSTPSSKKKYQQSTFPFAYLKLRPSFQALLFANGAISADSTVGGLRYIVVIASLSSIEPAVLAFLQLCRIPRAGQRKTVACGAARTLWDIHL